MNYKEYRILCVRLEKAREGQLQPYKGLRILLF
jgi:hypothetical protein